MGALLTGPLLPTRGWCLAEELDDEPSDDNGTDQDGKNPNLTPVGGGVTGSPSGLAKTLFASSEAGSVDPAVLVGEVLTYRVQVDVPAGTTYHGTLYDTLPSGMGYVAGSGRLARVFNMGLNSSADPGGVNAALQRDLCAVGRRLRSGGQWSKGIALFRRRYQLGQ